MLLHVAAPKLCWSACCTNKLNSAIHADSRLCNGGGLARGAAYPGGEVHQFMYIVPLKSPCGMQLEKQVKIFTNRSNSKKGALVEGELITHLHSDIVFIICHLISTAQTQRTCIKCLKIYLQNQSRTATNKKTQT